MLGQIRKEQLTYLLDHANPIIKALLLKELKLEATKEFAANQKRVLNMPIVQYWRNCLPMEYTLTSILGSHNTCFENAFGKLLSFGLNVEDICTQNQCSSLLNNLKDQDMPAIYGPLAQFVIAGYLHSGGFKDQRVYDIVMNRIETLYQFIKRSPLKFDIYDHTTDYKLPHNYQTKKVVNPQLYQDQELVLPLIYDFFVFSKNYCLFSEPVKDKINTIIDYIGQDQYQALDYGYGLIASNHNKFHAMGWSAHLPLFNEALSSDYFKQGLIHRMHLFSEFQVFPIQTWLQKAMKSLHDYQISDTRYLMPSHLIPEINHSYFMNGRHTNLGEDRKLKQGRIIESTYYVYRTTRHLT